MNEEFPDLLELHRTLYRRKRFRRVLDASKVRDGYTGWFRGISGKSKPKEYQLIANPAKPSEGYWRLVKPNLLKRKAPCPHKRAEHCVSPADVGHGKPVPAQEPIEDRGLHTKFPHPPE